MITEEHKDWIGISASDQSCYKWPDDTELHRQCRAAYVAGATDYSQQDLIEALEAEVFAEQGYQMAATKRIEALKMALEKIARMNGDPWRIARAAIDKDASG